MEIRLYFRKDQISCDEDKILIQKFYEKGGAVAHRSALCFMNWLGFSDKVNKQGKIVISRLSLAATS